MVDPYSRYERDDASGKENPTLPDFVKLEFEWYVELPPCPEELTYGDL